MDDATLRRIDEFGKLGLKSEPGAATPLCEFKLAKK
jgi:hypothetical protein